MDADFLNSTSWIFLQIFSLEIFYNPWSGLFDLAAIHNNKQECDVKMLQIYFHISGLILAWDGMRANILESSTEQM